MKQALLTLFLLGAACIPAASAQTSVALERAEGPVLAQAVGHYARSRSLLLAALREFDKADRLVHPGALLDVREWRSDILSRAEDLERVLDPQPRTTETGVYFQPDSRLLGAAGPAAGR